ncbi:MAG: DUF1566 domain-containing protein [Desulfamplus sp.]|nr:DUF1566 domain-containing protein [Desulfamplus sp.]
MMQKLFGHYEEDKTIFKDYLLREAIGRGRYGSVYLVESRARKRALKVFNHKINWERSGSSEDEHAESVSSGKTDLSHRVVTQGVNILNEFQSPYIVDVVDYGETVVGQSCVLMEYMPLSLEQALVKEERFSEEVASSYYIEILKGLQLQEMYGIIHRDIKPSNLFIFADTIKAGDHAFISNSDLSGTDDDISEAFGTPAYSAPEVFDACHSHATDRWAATVVFFQMLTGCLPFVGETVLSIMLAVMDKSPNYDLIPEKYRAFFKKCFHKNPRNRHSDVYEMFSEFEDCITADDIVYKTVQKLSKAPITSRIKILSSHPDSDLSAKLFDKQPMAQSQVKLPSSKIMPLLSEPTGDNEENFNNNRIWRLRNTPVFVSEDESQKVFGLNDSGRPFEYVENRYKVGQNGTIVDEATGLMWQQSGSDMNFPYEAAMEHIAQLNSNCFAGFTDWRIPTIAELLSLLEPEKINGYLHISLLFDSKQQWCWSSDKRTKGSGWYVFFYSGNVNWDFLDLDNYVRAVRL